MTSSVINLCSSSFSSSFKLLICVVLVSSKLFACLDAVLVAVCLSISNCSSKLFACLDLEF